MFQPEQTSWPADPEALLFTQRPGWSDTLWSFPAPAWTQLMDELLVGPPLAPALALQMDALRLKGDPYLTQSQTRSKEKWENGRSRDLRGSAEPWGQGWDPQTWKTPQNPDT